MTLPVLLSSDARRLRRAFSMEPRRGKGIPARRRPYTPEDRLSADFLSAEVGQRLFERLELLKLAPSTVLDLGCGAGRFSLQLGERFRPAQVIGLDIGLRLLHHARASQRRLLWSLPFVRARRVYVAGEAKTLPLASASVDLVFSNLMLPWVAEVPAVLAEIQRVLRPGGAVFFSTFGPDTLKELRACRRAAGPAGLPLWDMHDLGDALLSGGFSNPVVDMEMLKVTYADPHALLADLRVLGSCNLDPGRRRGLQGRYSWQAMLKAYSALAEEGRIPATFEVIYGHAWKGESPQLPEATERGGSAAQGRAAVVNFYPKRR